MKLIADTNVLIAASLPGNDASSVAARAMFEKAQLIAIPAVALCEFFWVMRTRFNRPKGEIRAAVGVLLAVETVVVDTLAVAAGLAFFDSGGDFADGVIAFEGRRLGGEVFASFDAKARRLAADNGFAVL